MAKGQPKLKIDFQLETIDSDTAMRYLESFDGNRDIRQSHIDYLAAQMKAGLWRSTHQAIAFDRNGKLIDGHHRMWAVIESKTTIEQLVARGVEPEDVAVIDSGLARKYADTAHYKGWNTDPATSSIARVLVLGIGSTEKVPPEVLQSWYKNYQAAIDFAIKLRLDSRPSTGKSITMPMTAAFARAFFVINTELLLRMAAILKTGQYEVNADKAAFALREAWLQDRLGHSRSEQYAKTEAAIRAFSERRAIKHLQRPETELFVIPKLPQEVRYTMVRSVNSPRTSKVARQKALAKA